MNDRVLLAYGRAMLSAQRLEERLRILFMLYKVVSGMTRPGEKLEEFTFAADEKSMGKALHGVFQKLADLGPSPFPDQARKMLWQTVQVRNFLVHHYFGKRGVLAKDKSACPFLIAELDWYSELFQAWVPTLDKWANMLLEALGINTDDVNSCQHYIEEVMVPDLREEQLKLLKEKLARVGIEVSAPPARRS